MTTSYYSLVYFCAVNGICWEIKVVAWVTFSAHPPEKVTCFKKGIRENLKIQKVACAQYMSFVLFHNYWTRGDDIALGSCDSGRMIRENNSEIPLSWISKSLVWLSSSLKRLLREVFRNMDSNLGFKQLLFLCCFGTVTPAWHAKVIYFSFITKLFLRTELNFDYFLALYLYLRFKGNMQLIDPIFIKSKVWLQWIIDKTMLMKMSWMLILVFLPMTLLFFENLVI